MCVTAVNEEDLAGGVGGAWGGEEEDGVGDFLWGSEAFAQGNAFFDGVAGGIWVGEGVEPVVIHGGGDFSGSDCVDADAVGGEVDGPFPGKGGEGAFGGGVT